MRCGRTEWDGVRWDGIGWDGIGWDGIGWDRVGWDRVGVIYICSMADFFIHIDDHIVLNSICICGGSQTSDFCIIQFSFSFT